MVELIAACITSIDVVVVFAFLQVRNGKFKLALWTSFLNMVFPFLGFMTGELSAHFFAGWSSLLSGALLALIGIHMLLQDDEPGSTGKQLHPSLIAFAVSIDSFSVSVSFGMLQLDKTLFILASGILTFFLSYTALIFKGRMGLSGGKKIRRFAGFALLVMGVMSCFR
ncbi:manganese efflux pump [Sporosarcina sp. YIM B06819]|uniref:manganese efflux pump n=1 Tax=Sporosarcina sp. YIM B06819 TaxID=3081769 RepID=UPI00298D494E|nr:manganese efflux pump [Sporosarcina sp. YIM B06819]